MDHLKKIVAMFALAGILALFVAIDAARQGNVEAAVFNIDVPLSGLQENPPVMGPGSGLARLSFDDVSRELTFSVTVSGLSPDQVTAAHIHRGAIGVNGPIIHNLSLTGFTTIAGKVTLSAADVADLEAGNLYVNVHSVANPGGFARGQIFLSPNAPIELAIRGAVNAWNSRDVDRFLSFFTDSGLMEELGFTSRAEAQMFLPEFIGDPPIVPLSVSQAQIDGLSARAVVELAFGTLIERSLYSFVFDGNWNIAHTQTLSPAIPTGTTVVDMRLQEYAFVYDKAATTSGNVAFRVQNTGVEPHEVVLFSIEGTTPLLQLIQSEEEPEEIEVIAQAGPFDPGLSTNLVFTKPLAAGRYGLVCFISAPNGTPHAFLGMASEFTVGAVAGGGITPPSTGHAGLATGSDSTKLYGALTVAIVAFTMAGGLLALARRRV